MSERVVDWVSVGSGLAGVTAALAVHDRGGTAVILEKAPKLGGVCAYSGGEVFVGNNHLQAASGTPDDPAAAKAYLDWLSGGYSDPELAGLLFTEGPRIVRLLGEKFGIPWRIIQDFPDYHFPEAPGTVTGGRYLETELFEGKTLGPWQKKSYTTPHMPPGIRHDELFAWGGLPRMLEWDFRAMGARVMADTRGMGPAMMGWFLKAALIDRNIEAHVGARVVELIAEGGRVVGVVAEQEGQRVRWRARRGVLLSVGGYDWNPELARSFEGLPEWRSMCQPSVEGDHVGLGCELGAALAGVPAYNLGMFFGFQVPGEQHEGKPLWRASWEGGYPHAIWVNRAGQRFADESFYRDYLPKVRSWDGTKQEHPNYPPFLIFDQNFRDKYALSSWMPGVPLPEAVVARGDTLAELAGKLGIDPAGLEATVARFNPMAEAGVDTDFRRGTRPWAAKMTGDSRRPNPNLGPLTKAPYYGVRLVPVGVGVNAVGLRTDAKARVKHVRGHVIPGLYAAGNSAALLDVGAGYQSGISNLRGIVWGWRAGSDALSV